MSQLTAEFFKVILQMEGGYQNRSDDTGNYNTCGQLAGTNMGVSAVALSTWYGRCVGESEMRAFTQQQAYNFYAWYFNKYGLFQVQNQAFAELLMNNTMGSPAGAAKSEQSALNALGYSVAVDGVRGPATISALNQAFARNPTGTYNAVRGQWVAYLESLNRPQFIDGWMYRMNRFFPPMAGNDSLVAIGLAAGLLFLALFKSSRK